MNTGAEPEDVRQSRAAPPFPGLRPFSSRDHKYFFGREIQKYALYLLLKRNHFISVVGSSGSGKSSIVRAGLLPMLADEDQSSGGNAWQYTTMRPGRDPIERLARALAKVSMKETDALFVARRDRIAAVLRASRDGIAEVLTQTAPQTAAQFVLVVDQFEELFRYLSAGAQTNRIETAKRREEATNFVQLLLAATRSYDSRIRVVITMRSDFIGDCANFQGLPEVVSAAQFLVPSLSRDQREEAIREPIALSGATIDSELVERLLNDSNEELDQLPVLQHCLARLWMRAGSAGASDPASGADPAPLRHLTEKDYLAIGGLAGALSGHADEIFGSLPGKEQIVEQIFRALTEIDKDGRAIRRPRELAQLIAETGADRKDVAAVLDQFRADDCSFIVPPLSLAPTAELPDDTVIDVGHEALLRRWKRVSGDPEATGERADKRDIGWLRQEQKDGERYQFLRSCVDPDSSNESRLSDDQAKRYTDWWDSWKPNPDWAVRYGGKFKDVERLIKESNDASRKARRRKNAAYAVIGTVLVLLAGGSLYLRQQQQFAAKTFSLAIDSALQLSKTVLDSFNEGQTSLKSATALRDIAADLYGKVDDLQNTSATAALKTSWLLTSSDLNLSLGDKGAARANVEQALSNARSYLEKEPANRNWRQLLYASLFRIGDLDLDESITRHDRKASERALEEYQASQRIADQLLANDVAHPEGENLAGVDYLAKQRFDLAFAINKLGEAMQVQGNLQGALGQYREALELAKAIENASRMEWKLQSAATRIKIASALRKSKKLDEALQNYSEAIGREEAIFATDPTHKILRSNLASAYENRALLFQERKDYDAAFRGFSDAVRLYAQLNEEDSRDTTWLENLAQVRLKYGTALEEYAKSQNQPLDKAIEQYGAEVAVRDKLAQRAPSNDDWQRQMRESRERLQRVIASAAAPPAKPAAAE
ncbi:MAG TPA: hypothetical protein VN065_03665 [Bradyrhizobium sp.]|nr:hypothetical protein [Bradyrhizobium sp.]